MSPDAGFHLPRQKGRWTVFAEWEANNLLIGPVRNTLRITIPDLGQFDCFYHIPTTYWMTPHEIDLDRHKMTYPHGRATPPPRAKTAITRAHFPTTHFKPVLAFYNEAGPICPRSKVVNPCHDPVVARRELHKTGAEGFIKNYLDYMRGHTQNTKLMAVPFHPECDHSVHGGNRRARQTDLKTGPSDVPS